MKLFRLLLWPFGFLYSLVLLVRHWAYDIGVLKKTSFKTPTICVGNLSLGGTGKTPMIALLLAHYNKSGATKAAVLSRGYGRKTKGLLEAHGQSSVLELGDEPFQLHQSFPENRLVVCENRVKGMQYLEGQVFENNGFPTPNSVKGTTFKNAPKPLPPSVVLLDDAFQHRALNPFCSILLTSFFAPYFSDFYLPSGTLRDHKKRAQTATIIVVTKCPENMSLAQREVFVRGIKPRPHQKIFFSYLSYAPLWKGVNTERPVKDFIGVTIALVTAIANPKPLLTYLGSLGVKVEHHRFADHHFFTPRELKKLAKNKVVVCTEKDFAKLSPYIAQLLYIPVAHQFFKDDEEGFHAALPLLE